MSAATPALTAADDRRHRPADGEKGRDSLYFSVVLPDGPAGVRGVFVYTWVDHTGAAGRLVTLWTPDGDAPRVLDVVHGVDVGDRDFDDWEVAGLRLSHPDALRTVELSFRGDDLEVDYRFEGTHEAFDYARNPAGCPRWMAVNRFEQTGRVTGRVQVGHDVVELDTPAHRDHSWGRRNWRMPQHWKWIVAQTDQGHGVNLFQPVVRGELGANGYVLRGGEPVALVGAECRATYRDDMTSDALHATLHDERGGTTELVLERCSSFEMPVGRRTEIHEAACRAWIDGVPGRGQFETQWPASYVAALRGSDA